MSLIAVRRNIQANALFFEERNGTIWYSLDRVNWLFGWTQPTEASVKLFNLARRYESNYYQNETLTNIINPPQDPAPTTRTGIIENIEDVEDRRISNRAICAGANVLINTLNEAGRLKQAEEITTLQTIVQNASIIVGAVGALVGVVASAGTGIVLVGGAVATRLASDVGYPVVLDNLPYLTPAQIENAVCIIYEATKNGNFNYDTVAGLDPIPSVNWSELYTPELHSAFIAMIDEQLNSNDPCPCETCYEFLPVNTTIARGQVFSNSVITVDTIVSGSLREMQAILTIDLIETLIINKVTVWYALQHYENQPTTVPYIQFASSGTGGGTTAILNGFNRVELNPAHFALVGVNQFTLRLIASLCSACSATQLNSYNPSYGLFNYIEVCGTPA